MDFDDEEFDDDEYDFEDDEEDDDSEEEVVVAKIEQEQEKPKLVELCNAEDFPISARSSCGSQQHNKPS